MKKLLILLVLVGLLGAGDLWIKGVAEQRIASELQSSFDADGEASVSLSGFPFTLRLLSGSIPEAELSSSSLVRNGVRFTDVGMTLQDVEFSWSKIFAGEVGSVSVRDGHGSAQLHARALTKLFGAVIGDAELSIEGTDLVLYVAEIDRTVRVRLPRFVQGLRYRSVRIEGDEAVIEFSLENASFERF